MRLKTNYKASENEHNYEIIVEQDALLSDYNFSLYHQRFALIDTYVYELHQTKIDAFLVRHAIEKILIPSGEAVKTIAQYECVLELLLDKNIKRNDCLFAIGGGATGDFTGFAAATVLRGIHFIQVPTTILAHDAAIGGKTGINSSKGKNLIGAFKRPDAVIYDTAFLTTLSQQEKLSGFAEILKHVLLNGSYEINNSDCLKGQDLERLMNDFQDIDDYDDYLKLQYWISYGIKTKLHVVEQDELESDLRKFLNFGHTFGHALEFTHKVPHGIAVMHGMMFALILSGYDRNAVDNFYKWIKQLGYPMIEPHEFNKYFDLMRKDKKNQDAKVSFVVMQQQQGTLSEIFKIKTFDERAMRNAFMIWQEVMRSCYNEPK